MPDRRLLVTLLLAASIPTTTWAQDHAHHQAADTIHLEVGSPQLDGRVYKPHKALVRIRIGDPKGPVLREWTNELQLGDSAGRPVMRWTTTGKVNVGPNATATWVLRQTYDHITLKPYQYNSSYSTGVYTRVTIDGNHVHGVSKGPNDAAEKPIDITLDRPGYFAGASDIVPAAVGFKKGAIMTAPVWNPSMTKAETRIFVVVGLETIDVEGTMIESWKVEERRTDNSLYATWWLLDKSPYMVYGEIVLPDGRVQRMTEVEVK